MSGNGHLHPIPRLLVFDVDGTLTDTLGLMVDVMEVALKSRGHPVPPAREIREKLGIALDETIRDLVPGADPAEVAAIEQVYRQSYAPEEGRRGVRLFDGVRETLTRLQERGFRLAIATGKSRIGLVRLLENLDLNRFFPLWRTADITQPKPHPQMLMEILDATRTPPDSAVMIGDSTWDLEMARAAGVRALAATYGAHPRERLARSAPAGWLDRFPDLLPLLGL